MRTNDCRIKRIRARTPGSFLGSTVQPMPRNPVTTQVSMNIAARYSLGVLVGVFAVVVRIWLTPVIGDRSPYITVFATLMFAARYLGWGPAMLTVMTSLFGLWSWLLAPGQT